MLIFRKGIKGLVIDPWNEMEHNRPSNMSETEYISESLSKIRKFARQHGVHIWLVAHPKKMQKGKNGVIPIPTAYDINGSAGWYNKGDNIVIVWRDPKKWDGFVLIAVQKIRFKEIGKTGFAELKYIYESGTYEDWEGDLPDYHDNY